MDWQLLREVLTDEQMVINGEEIHALGNDGRVTVYPRTEDDIVAVISLANQQGWRVIPTGRGTKRGFGGVEERTDILLSLEQYTGIVEHSAADLTIIVRAGTTMQEIQDYLAPYGQMVALDPAWPDKASIGGIIAANDSGPKRLRYGSARDQVLGLRVVYPDGKVLRSGGRTVKNVAGYDLNKLFVGSMGTLGIISTVTLKLRPLPKFESLCLVSFPQHSMADIRNFVIQFQDTHLEPVSIEVLSPELTNQLLSLGVGEGYYALAIAFEDRESAVHYQEEWLKRHLPSYAELRIMQQEEAKDWWRHFASVGPVADKKEQISLKIGSNNLAVLEIVEYCQERGSELELHVLAHGGAGHGLSKVHVQGREEQLRIFIDQVRSFAQERKGYVVIQHAPLTFRRVCSVWGPPPTYYPLLVEIKRTFDPQGILSPKRYIGGL